MTSWREVKLGDIASFKYGKMPSKEDIKDAGKYPIYSGYRYVGYTDKHNLDENQLIIVARGVGGTGDVKLSKEKCFLTNLSIATNIKSDGVCVKYLYYYFQLHNLRYLDSGSAQSQITISDLEKLKIPLPPIDVQKKIAGVLGALDDKIELNNKINNNLEQQAQAVFLKIINSNKFDNKLLSEIATIKYGKGLPTNKLTKTGYKVFGGNGIIGYYTEYLYKEPQILISCRGAASGTILESHPYSYVTNNSLVVELNDRRYYEFLKQYFSLNQLHSYATGSAQPQITIDNLKTLEVPYPNYEVISDIDAYFISVSNKIYENICENEKIMALRDTLLPKLMKGEIDVSNVNISDLTSADKLSFSGE